MEGPDALTRLRASQKAAARAGRRVKAACTCPLAGTVKGLCREGGRATPSEVPAVTVYVTGWWQSSGRVALGVHRKGRFFKLARNSSNLSFPDAPDVLAPPPRTRVRCVERLGARYEGLS